MTHEKDCNCQACYNEFGGKVRKSMAIMAAAVAGIGASNMWMEESIEFSRMPVDNEDIFAGMNVMAAGTGGKNGGRPRKTDRSKNKAQRAARRKNRK